MSERRRERRGWRLYCNAAKYCCIAAITASVAGLAIGPLAGCKREPVITVRFDPPDLARTAPPAKPAAPGDAAAGARAATPEGCAGDAGCVAVKADCCGCTAGGKAEAIPLTRREAHEEALAARCADVMCPQVMSNDPSCARVAACREGRCVLVEPGARR